MRKRIKIILSFLVVISVMGIGLIGYAQPNIPQESIPTDIPADMREQIEKLYSWNPLKRADAAFHLGVMGKRAAPAIPFLIDVLKDENSSVRMNAAWALMEIKDPRAVEPLIAALKDKDRDVREYAAKALGEIGDERAVEPLIAALKDEVWLVRRYAAEALGKITEKDFGEDSVKWQEWWEKNKAK